MKNIRVTVICCFLGFIFNAHSQGYIVPNGVIYVDNSPSSISEIDVIQNPLNLDYTGFLFTPQGANTFSFGVIADEGVRVFAVSPNDPISMQPILSQNYSELSLGTSYTFASGVPFYLGLYTGYSPYNSQGNYTGIYTSPVFGWARLVNVGGTIQLLSGAAEIQGGGIYVGTQNIIPVPEPSAVALATTATLALGCHMRRRNGATRMKL